MREGGRICGTLRYYEDRAHALGEGLLAESSAGYLELRRLKLKHAWQLTVFFCYKSSTAAYPQAVQFRSQRWLSGRASGW